MIGNISIITLIFLTSFCFLFGMDSIWDCLQIFQPIVSCTVIGIILGNPTQGIILGGTLQMITLGWMNIGAAISPDTALTGIISAILVCGPAQVPLATGIALAIPVSVAGLVIQIFIRTIAVSVAHAADRMAEKGQMRAIGIAHIACSGLHGLKCAIPAVLVCFIPVEAVKVALDSLPQFVTNGLAIGGGMIVVVGYAVVIDMIGSNELWPVFFAGFVFASLTELNLIALGVLGLVGAVLFIFISKAVTNMVGKGGGNRGLSKSDKVSQILEGYEG